MHSFDPKHFHVLTMISNPVRYQSRYRLYLQFAEYMKKCGANLWTIEVQTGDRGFAITDASNPRHIQIRHWDQIWLKESAINVGIRRLSEREPNWETMAWADADTKFIQDDWIEQTLHQLQIYQIAQMWETAADLGPNGEIMAVHKSFMSQYIKCGARFPEGSKSGYMEWHPGYFFGARREAIEGMGGGLLDRAILGASDRHMCLSWVGRAQNSFHPDSNSEYKNYILQYQEHCEKSIRRDVGYVPLSLVHFFHGKKRDRRYFDRWQILVKNNYRPYHDVKPNSDGLLCLHDDYSDRFLRLRDELRGYFAARHEDSIDVD